MSKGKGLGDVEKLVLAGSVAFAFWMGINALAKRAEQRNAEAIAGEGTTTGGRAGEGVGAPSTRAGRRAQVAWARRPRVRTHGRAALVRPRTERPQVAWAWRRRSRA